MKLILSAMAAAALSSVARGDGAQCDSNPLFVLTGPSTIPLGGSDLLEFNTQHTTPGLVFVSLGCGPTSTPYGTFCLDFPVPLVKFFISDSAGYYSVPLKVPDNPKLDCLSLYIQYAVCNTGDPTQRGISNHLKLTLGGTCVERCPEAAVEDQQYSQNGGGHAFYIPGLGTQYVFIADGMFEEHVELGTGRLTGFIEQVGEPGNQWQVEVDLGGRVDPGDASYPPAGSPYKQLDPSAYVENGGPIDTSLWYYYETTDGLLTGLGNNAGALISFSRMGPAFQVGFGANGKNLNYGGSGWFTGTYTDAAGQTYGISGDINIDLNDCPN